MNCTRLKQIRKPIYDCFERGADALFNLADADARVKARRSRCRNCRCRRSLSGKGKVGYEALSDGCINVEQLRALWVKALLSERAESELIWIGVDTSNLSRADAETSADRTIIHLSNLPLVDKAIGIGWTFSTVVLLPEQASSWTPILDQERVSSEQTEILVAIAQLQALRPLFGNRRVIILADRWYGTPQFLRACHSLGVSRADPAEEQSQALSRACT